MLADKNNHVNKDHSMKFAANNSIEAGIWNDARGGFIMIVNSRGQGVRDAKSIMSFFEKPPESCPHHNNRIATQTPSPKLMSFGNSRSAVRFSYLGKNGAGGEARIVFFGEWIVN